MLIGYTMKLISVNMLFIMLFILTAGLTYLTHEVYRLFKEEK